MFLFFIQLQREITDAAQISRLHMVAHHQYLLILHHHYLLQFRRVPHRTQNEISAASERFQIPLDLQIEGQHFFPNLYSKTKKKTNFIKILVINSSTMIYYI